MNRQQRRQQTKLSRHASDDEIFPGKHGPIVETGTAERMTSILRTLQTIFGDNYDITMFIAERSPTEGRDMPRFNYMSTADRRDMYAVIRAWLKKNEALGADLDKINDAPPSERAQ